MAELPKVDLESKDLVAERIEQMKVLFPEIVVDGDISREKLLLLLGDFEVTDDERYSFDWPGKIDAIKQSQQVSSATLRPNLESSVEWSETGNLYIEGDNLEVLKLLQRAYHGKVQLIYIDPPYNTGHDFVYKDKFGDTIENYKAQAGLSNQSNADTSGRYHSDWCSMIYPRLRLARELLDDTGAIFISIDDNEVTNLRKICDEVFGESCFIADIAWQKTYAPKNNSQGIPAEVEHIIAYSRYPNWSPNRLPRTEEMNSRYKSPDGDETPWKSGDSSAPGAVTHQGMVYAIQHPFTGDLMYPPMSCCWRAAQEDLLAIMNEWAPYELRDIDDAAERAHICGISPDSVRPGVKSIMLKVPVSEASTIARKRYDEGSWPLFYFTSGGRGRIAKKVYLKESLGRIPTNLWPFSEVGHSDSATKELKELFDGELPFDTPKPVKLMMRILEIGSKSGDLILDFFSGSASMAHAIMQMNAERGEDRRFIMVQLPEATDDSYGTLCKIGEERIRRAGKKIRDEINANNVQLQIGETPTQLPDIGFRVFELDESGIQKPEEGQLLIDRIKPDRTDLDIIFEMMLKWGLELTYPVEKDEINGYPIYSIAYDELICCMQTGLTTDVLETIAARNPRRVFLLDSVIDDTIKLNALQIFKRVEERTQQKIDLRTV